MKVTLFKNVYDKKTPHHVTLKTALRRIQEGKSSSSISDVRQGNKEAKLKLPVVCFSGEFSSRSDEALFEHSGYIILDFDHVDVEATKKHLGTDDLQVETASKRLLRSLTQSDTETTSER